MPQRPEKRQPCSPPIIYRDGAKIGAFRCPCHVLIRNLTRSQSRRLFQDRNALLQSGNVALHRDGGEKENHGKKRNKRWRSGWQRNRTSTPPIKSDATQSQRIYKRKPQIRVF